MTKKPKKIPLSLIEEFAASSWLAGVSLRELAGSDRVSTKAFLTCHRVYTKLDTMADVCELRDMRNGSKKETRK